MATTKKPRTRIAPTATPNSKAISGLARNLTEKAKADDSTDDPVDDEVESDEPQVMTNVATAFNLTMSDGTIKRYEAGACRMPQSHADHWYAKAHGTKIVD